MEKGYIYKIVNSENDKVYIGQTTRSLHIRFNEHLNYKRDTHLTRAFNKYGRCKFNIIKICCVIGSKEYVINKLNKLEMYYIEKYDSRKNGYNMTDGGEGTPGKYVSDETKQKISNALKGKMVGEKNPNYGNHKMAGKNNPNYGNTGIRNVLSVIVYCIEFKEIFYGAREAERLYGVEHSRLIKVCNGKRKSAGKHPETGEPLHWLYVEDAIEQGYITQEELDDYLNGLREKEKETK